MPAQPFAVEWWFAGHTGREDDVDVSWFESVALFNAEQSFVSVSVSCWVDVDVAALTRTVRLDSGRARIYHGGRAVLDGNWSGVSFEEPVNGRTFVSFTVSTAREEDKGTWPSFRGARLSFDPSAIVTIPEMWFYTVPDAEERFAAYPWIYTDLEDRIYGNKWETQNVDVELNREYNVALGDVFPDMPDSVAGDFFPYVFGAPGVTRGGSIPAVPCQMVVEAPGYAGGTPAKYIVAMGTVDAPTLTLHGLSMTAANDFDFTTDEVPIYHESLEDGTVYAYILGSDFSNIENDTQYTYRLQFYTAWTGGEGVSGGAGDMLIDLYTSSTVAVNYASFAHARAYLNTYRLAGYVDVAGSPLRMAESAILPLLPCAVVPGTRGRELVVYPWADDGADDRPGLPLVRGQDIDLAGPVTMLDSDRVSSVVVQYARREDTGGYFAVQTDGLSQSAGPSKHFDQGTTTITADNVWDEVTAARIARDHLRFRNYSPRVIPYQVLDVDRFGIGGRDEMRVGMRVDVTDDALSLASERGIIGEIERTAESVVIRVYLEDPDIRRE